MSLPLEPSPEAAERALKGVCGLLRRALPLCGAHTVGFFTRGLWAELVAVPPQTVLNALSGQALRRLLEDEEEQEEASQRPLMETAGKHSPTETTAVPGRPRLE